MGAFCGAAPVSYTHLDVYKRQFLDKWGHLSIFLGRFFPFIRTFVPFIAGMGGMHWRNFVIFNVLGGITWSTLFTLLGYFFGGIPFVQMCIRDSQCAVVAPGQEVTSCSRLEMSSRPISKDF